MITRTSFLCLVVLLPSLSRSQTLQDHWWRPDGTVRTILADSANNRVFLGGDFHQVGPHFPNGAIVDDQIGTPLPGNAKPNSAVQHAVPDGAGGWFIQGQFTTVDGQPRPGLARIDADGTLNPWQVSVEGYVYNICYEDGILYIYGYFTAIDGLPRQGLAAYEVVSSTWLELGGPSSIGAYDNSVNVMKASGDTLYLGFGYDMFFINERVIDATLTTTSGAVVPNGTHPNDQGAGLCVPDGNGGWFIAGYFTRVGNEERHGLARINPDGSLHPWNPTPDQAVKSMDVENGVLYLGGAFTVMDGQSRRFIAAFDIATGNLLPLGATHLDAPDYDVDDVDAKDGLLYLGGQFQHMGKDQPFGGAFDLASSTVLPASTHPDGPVYTCVADSAGGWFIGGDFAHIGAEERKGLARINPDGSLHPWNPSVEGSVKCMVFTAGRLYVGGSFTAVGDQLRYNLAEVDTASGALGAWDPSSNAEVTSIAVLDSSIFIGGEFSSAGGIGAMHFGRIDRSSGGGIPVSFSTTDDVHALAVHDDHVYICGSFSQRLVAFNAQTNALASWYPNPVGTVHSLVVHGDGLFVGGTFTSMGGSAREGLASFDLSGGIGVLNAWAPVPQYSGATVLAANDTLVMAVEYNRVFAFNPVTADYASWWTAWNKGYTFAASLAMAFSGPSAYVGGTFGDLFAQRHTYTACIDLSNGLCTAWNPVLNDRVQTVLARDGEVILGGNFTTASGITRNKLAKVSATTGVDMGWNPNPNGTVSILAAQGNDLYVRGDFTSIGGGVRNGLAKFTMPNGTLAAWNPSVNGGISGIALQYPNVFLSGWFASVGGGGGVGLACVDATTGLPSSWAPGLAGIGACIALQDTLIYVGGYLGTSAARRTGLAALRASTGELLDWQPSPNNNSSVSDLVVTGSNVYVCGTFSTIGGQARNKLAAVSRSTGLATSWSPNPNNYVGCLAATEQTLFVSGSFTTISGSPRSRLASFSLADGGLTPWAPNSTSGVTCMAVDTAHLFMGGNFSSVAGIERKGAAAFDLGTGEVTPWDPRPNAYVQTLSIGTGGIYLGGSFRTLRGVSRRGVAALDATTGVALDFDANVAGYVNTLALVDETLFIGGNFNHVGGMLHDHLAAVDNYTGALLPWSPSSDDPVTALLAENDTLYVGGSVLRIMDGTNGVPFPWPSTAYAVSALAKHGGTLFVGGDFISIGGQQRYYVGAVNAQTGTALPWNPLASGRVRTLAVVNNDVYVGGDFEGIGLMQRPGIAKLDGISGLARAWSPGLSVGTSWSGIFGHVNAVLPTDSTLFTCGSFESLGSVDRHWIAELDTSLGAFTSWNANMKRRNTSMPPQPPALCLARLGGTVFVGGAFQYIQDRPSAYFAALTSCVENTYFLDLDEDGFGDPSTAVTTCTPGQTGYVQDGSDCNDEEPGFQIGAECDDTDPTTVNDIWTSNCTCVGELTTSTEEGSASPQVLVWPDPAHTQLYWGSPLSGHVIDVSGRSVLSFQNTDILEVVGLQPGCYVVVFSHGSRSPFIKE